MKPWLPAAVAGSLFFAFAVVEVSACQYLDAGESGGVDAGPLGSVCCGGNGSCSDGLECCSAAGSACDYDYECCGGLCSGTNMGSGLIGSASGTCVSAGNTDCSAALGSRCTTDDTCSCSSDSDCCDVNASCSASVVTSKGKRCCLPTGQPCGGDGDCCSNSCDPTELSCD